MRIMPFMKRKKGVQFAGIGLDTGGGGGGLYVLPPATANTLGGVKVGQGLSITSDGTLSIDGGCGSFDFSTTEVNTGQKWVDGKSIYCIVKTSDFTTCPIFDTLIEYTGVAHRQGYGYFTFNNGLGTALGCSIRPSDAKNGTVNIVKENDTVIDQIIYYYTK